MSLSRITTRISRTVLTQCRNSALLSGRHESNALLSSSGGARQPYNTVASGQVSMLHHSALKSSGFQWLGFSSSASPHPDEKETSQTGNKQENKEKNEAAPHDTETGGKTEAGFHPNNHTGVPPKFNFNAEDIEFLDAESDSESSDLVKVFLAKQKSLVSKEEEVKQLKDKVLRTLAEMENVKERTRRECENSKKFAIQNFAKSLLDVADNLGRASSAAKESFSKIDASTDAAGAVKQLKTLLEGVEMTEKQLSEVFKKFELEKYDPIDEEFDPNRHNAVFQVPDPSKPADRVAVVLKAGYILHDRIIRPAEVGVTVAASNEES